MKHDLDDIALSMPDELRKMSIQDRVDERDFKRRQADEELRRWCIEQSPNDLRRAQMIYDWVRNQPKADAA